MSEISLVKHLWELCRFDNLKSDRLGTYLLNITRLSSISRLLLYLLAVSGHKISIESHGTWCFEFQIVEGL